MKRAYRLYTILLVSEMILAAVCGPYSCEWGNEVYAYAGLAGLLLSLLFPALQKDWLRKKRVVMGILFLLGSVVLWCAGFVLGEFRITCRLF